MIRFKQENQKYNTTQNSVAQPQNTCRSLTTRLRSVEHKGANVEDATQPIATLGEFKKDATYQQALFSWVVLRFLSTFASFHLQFLQLWETGLRIQIKHDSVMEGNGLALSKAQKSATSTGNHQAWFYFTCSNPTINTASGCLCSVLVPSFLPVLSHLFFTNAS